MNHIAGFAAGLSERGHACAVAVPANPGSFKTVPSPQFKPLMFDDLTRSPLLFPDGRGVDVVHAWTPRHHVALASLRVMGNASPSARLVVHMEDDEEHLAAIAAGMSFPQLQAATPDSWRTVLDRGLIHPWRHRLLLHAADAITCITHALEQLSPQPIKTSTIYPPVDEMFFQVSISCNDAKARLKVPANTKTIVYHGGVNPANAAEVRDLYQAVALLNSNGHPTLLLRTGRTPDWFKKDLTPTETFHVRDLGFVERSTLPELLSAADVLVQPGRPGPFNAHRLPSKLAEFLAVGGAVIMPACNIASELNEGVDALFLHTGDPAEIADCCLRLFHDDNMCNRMRTSARLAARKLFDAKARVEDLERCYVKLITSQSAVNWSALSDDSLDESMLFQNTIHSNDLVSALRWAGHEPALPLPWWKRLFSKT